MNNDLSPTPAASGAVPADDAGAAHRLPGPLGRRRERLPVAESAPLIPTALSAFNRLTGRLDRSGSPEPPAEVDGRAAASSDAEVAAELSGTPVEPLRTGRRRFGRRR
jgi:hypothetical protein